MVLAPQRLTRRRAAYRNAHLIVVAPPAALWSPSSFFLAPWCQTWRHCSRSKNLSGPGTTLSAIAPPGRAP
ncbi:hypothetical protein Syun_002428 [Stephania yunnanensis]|uniref:Uncharacterized protein n=1 Tax=Stephania yunnanensis TaxID=152371 RepID=A0AAP0Q807_9MAGN